MANSLRAYRARYVIPIDQPPIPNGYVAVAKNSIVAVAPWSSKNQAAIATDCVIDLGEVAIIPALVNAHTHLEFSNLRQPLGLPGMDFTDWIRLVVAARNKKNGIDAGVSKTKTILRGLAESYRSGVGCIGEIATAPVSLADYHCPKGLSGVDVVIFFEQLGRNPDLFSHRQSELNQFLRVDSTVQPNAENEALQVLPAVSPHAPYSVHPDLLRQMIDTAVATQVPVAMHLMESEAERELLMNRTGSFAELLRDFGIWDPSSFLPVQSIGNILEDLSRCARVQIVHGNYLNHDEIQLISKHRERMTVIYCPRTHEYFQHASYPLEQLHRAGILVGLGTDSRASNPDLNLFAELQTVARKFPKLPHLAILEMGTLNGAKSMGKATRLGSLSPGKLARFGVLEHSDSSSANLNWLLDRQTKCRPLVAQRSVVI